MKRPIVRLDIRVIYDKKKYQVEVRDTGRQVTTARGFFQSPQDNTNEGILRRLNEEVEYSAIRTLQENRGSPLAGCALNVSYCYVKNVDDPAINLSPLKGLKSPGTVRTINYAK